MRIGEFINKIDEKCAHFGLIDKKSFKTDKEEMCYAWSKYIGKLVHRLELIHPIDGDGYVRGEMEAQLIVGLLKADNSSDYRTIDFINLADTKDGRTPFKIWSRNFLSVKVFKMDLEADFKLLFFGGFVCL